LDHEVFYWDAFNNLTSERAFGMGVGPIPYSAIRRYADEFEIRSRDEFAFFSGIMQALDSEYLALINKPKGEADMVPVTDVAEQHLVFERLRARANAAAKAKKNK
jgi:hypothetical protein